MTWTQPVCENRFQELNPGRSPVIYKLQIPESEWEPCCFCKEPTNIYVRLDPKTVPYPREET